MVRLTNWSYPTTVPTKLSWHYAATLHCVFRIHKNTQTHLDNSDKYPSQTEVDEAFVTEKTKIVMVVMAADWLTMLYDPAG